MDKRSHYRKTIRQILETYVRWTRSKDHDDTEVVIDPERDHYELLQVGWDEDRRIHHCVIHVDIRDGKFWIQYDGTDRPVAEELLDVGVPREDIVLAFHPAELRQYTGFAVG